MVTVSPPRISGIVFPEGTSKCVLLCDLGGAYLCVCLFGFLSVPQGGGFCVSLSLSRGLGACPLQPVVLPLEKDGGGNLHICPPGRCTVKVTLFPGLGLGAGGRPSLSPPREGGSLFNNHQSQRHDLQECSENPAPAIR